MRRPDAIEPLLRPRATWFDILCWIVLAAFAAATLSAAIREALAWMR